MALRAVFLGTPDVAVTVLDALQNSDHQVIAVVTAPDRPRGRGMEVSPSPVKNRALEQGLPVFQPPSLKDPSVQSELAGAGADVLVVAAYGLILPDPVLKGSRLGCVNLHFSLLPEYRGAAPVQWALIDGREKTGVTIMQVEAGLDSGPILSQEEELIGPNDTAGSLTGRLAVRGARLMVDTLDRLERGDVSAQPQDEDRASYASKITPADARIEWSASADQIERRVRAFDPAPGAWTMLDGRRIKIWRVEVMETHGGPAGTLAIDGERMTVSTGSTDMRLVEIQPEGRHRLMAEEFVRGHRPASGMRFS